MILYNNEITIHRGESFTLERSVVNRDGSPYIVSSAEQNPYLAITITATRYDQLGRYKRTWWISLKDFPRFKYTTVKDIANYDGQASDAAYDYLYNVNGDYRYWDGSKYVPYAFSFVKVFNTDTTNELVEQNYLYDVKHVYGNSTRDLLVSLCNIYAPQYMLDHPNASAEDIYDKLFSIDEAYVEGIDYNVPIYNTKVQTVLLAPTRMTVQSYLRRL